MQIFTDPVVNDIASAMLSDEATVVTRETPTPQPTAPVAAPTPEPAAASKPVEVSKPAFQTLASSGVSDGDILSFNTGSVIELEKLTDEPLDILLNGKLIATGEVVVINENFGVRITNILSQKQRIHNLH